MRGKNLLGIILVLIGVGLILDKITSFTLGEVISTWWPSILIFIGTYQLARSAVPLFGGIILIGAGVWFQLNRLNMLPDDSLKFFWPAVLIILGLWVIFSRKSPWVRTISSDGDDVISQFVIFSGVEAKSISTEFRGGSISALFGGAEIDLRQAKMAGEIAEIDLFAAFGGVDLKVPEDWQVEVTGLPLFGGWSNKTVYNPQSEGKRVLKVKCLVMFGGATVKN